MRKWIVLATVVMMTMFGLTACGSSNVKINSEANGQNIEMNKGQKLVLSLEGNPTTGYSWEVSENDEAVLKQNGEAEYKADSNLIGAGGVFTFTFDAVQTGTTSLKLIYHRAWEKDVPPIEEFQVTVNIK